MFQCALKECFLVQFILNMQLQYCICPVRKLESPSRSSWFLPLNKVIDYTQKCIFGTDWNSQKDTFALIVYIKEDAIPNVFLFYYSLQKQQDTQYTRCCMILLFMDMRVKQKSGLKNRQHWDNALPLCHPHTGLFTYNQIKATTEKNQNYKTVMLTQYQWDDSENGVYRWFDIVCVVFSVLSFPILQTLCCKQSKTIIKTKKINVFKQTHTAFTLKPISV